MNSIVVKWNLIDFLLERITTVSFYKKKDRIAELRFLNKNSFKLSIKERCEYKINCVDNNLGLEFEILNLQNQNKWLLLNENREFSFGKIDIPILDTGEIEIRVKSKGRSNTYYFEKEIIGKTDSTFLNIFKLVIKEVDILNEEYFDALLVGCSIEIIQEYHCKLFQGVD
ncbi:hypothetical protein VBY74_08990 [Tenacibaculum ascidiaceicola]|uniref:hypothetical protein n=1 Tax=Tenacibaculum ascidiaceicola TaxID=1699411 RepID=UPI0039EB3D39